MSAIQSVPEELAKFENLQIQLSDIKRATSIHTELIALAESLVRRFPHEADAHHLLGIAWYEYPCASSYRSWRCKSSLMKAVQIEPDHQYALQYLAYLAFDQERYDEALKFQQQLKHDYFIERDQEWRALKNAETSLVCKVRICSDELPEQEFSAFCTWYLDAEKRENSIDPNGSYVWPQELRELAEWLFENGTVISDAKLQKILKFLHQISYHNTLRNMELRSYTEALPDLHG
ncbi:hypothetical protein SAMN02745166_00974 [Prosthecobacter debontii]|uniref:Tetratricopeptide repeat-containing protein n=1 Tax=Prosthecobacter debontii TaxID=48467 RepID=A0A1T4X2Z5_9BACT|nr:hypothetical protein [Prosthecobacter debontii]SKA84013.1 hypothetical protein SAMN02745166_00974 [Prosthecobacter debontii]